MNASDTQFSQDQLPEMEGENNGSAVLPNDVLSYIFAFLPSNEIWQLRRLNKYWKAEMRNQNSFANLVASSLWFRRFHRILESTAQYIHSEALVHSLNSCLLAELHQDCSYSGFLVKSPFVDKKFGDGEKLWSTHHHIPILRDALEEHLYRLNELLKRKFVIHRESYGLTKGISTEALSIMLRATQKSNAPRSSAIEMLNQLSPRVLPIIFDKFSNKPQLLRFSEELEYMDNVDPFLRGLNFNLTKLIGFNNPVTSWREAIPCSMATSEKFRRFMRPLLIYCESMVVLRDKFDIIRLAGRRCHGQLYRHNWHSVSYQAERQCFKETNVMALRVIRRMFPLDQECVELPITLNELRELRKRKWCGQNVCPDTRLSPDQRRSQIAAELYIPMWLIKAMQRIGKLSFIESTAYGTAPLPNDEEGLSKAIDDPRDDNDNYIRHSLYFLLSQCDDLYLVGFFWQIDAPICTRH